tara:strand:+ start:2345 stop:3004 length:660 start_codon:yes stop_codon:yes gene_type:complete
MFTGIVISTGKLTNTNNEFEIEILGDEFDINIGDSILVDGICLTVKSYHNRKFLVDVSEETLLKTSLNYSLDNSRIVNLEPALKINDRLGGHIVTGHIDGLGEVISIREIENSWIIKVKWLDNKFAKYICLKGSICINGVSLTISDCNNSGLEFSIAVIPHTWKNTTLNLLRTGSLVNLEGDIISKYVESLLKNRNIINDSNLSSSDISLNWLKDNGWQ